MLVLHEVLVLVLRHCRALRRTCCVVSLSIAFAHIACFVLVGIKRELDAKWCNGTIVTFANAKRAIIKKRKEVSVSPSLFPSFVALVLLLSFSRFSSSLEIILSSSLFFLSLFLTFSLFISFSLPFLILSFSRFLVCGRPRRKTRPGPSQR